MYRILYTCLIFFLLAACRPRPESASDTQSSTESVAPVLSPKAPTSIFNFKKLAEIRSKSTMFRGKNFDSDRVMNPAFFTHLVSLILQYPCLSHLEESPLSQPSNGVISLEASVDASQCESSSAVGKRLLQVEYFCSKPNWGSLKLKTFGDYIENMREIHAACLGDGYQLISYESYFSEPKETGVTYRHDFFGTMNGSNSACRFTRLGDVVIHEQGCRYISASEQIYSDDSNAFFSEEIMDKYEYDVLNDRPIAGKSRLEFDGRQADLRLEQGRTLLRWEGGDWKPLMPGP